MSFQALFLPEQKLFVADFSFYRWANGRYCKHVSSHRWPVTMEWLTSLAMRPGSWRHHQGRSCRTTKVLTAMCSFCMHLNRVNFSINCLTDDSRPPFRFELKLPEESVNILARQCFSLRGQRFLSDFYHSLEHTNFQYVLKQWIMLKARSDWLVKLQISFAIYLRAIREIPWQAKKSFK